MTKRRWIRYGAMPVAWVALTMPALFSSGCDGDNPLDALCCSDFEVGADLSNVDFEAGVEFNAFMQAVADFGGVATGMTAELTASCRSLAVDLGADAMAEAPTDPSAAVGFWCGQVTAMLEASGSVSIEFQPPSCSVDFNVQASCEGGCTVSGECDPGSIEARCEGGEIKGKCEGMCSGKCEGSANLAVACEGTCMGTCQGDCSGMCSGGGGGGMCNGQCDGTCMGECRGSCEVEAGAMVECSGECSGGCDVEITAPKCTGTVMPPMCDLNADCQASCKASAEAKAECKPPSVEIVATGNLSAQALGSLKLHLPNIVLVAEAKAEKILASAEGVLSIGGNFVASGNLSVKAVACAGPAVETISTAVTNIDASLSASASVVTMLGG